MKRNIVVLMVVLVLLASIASVCLAAFSSTVTSKTVQGDKRVVYGTFTNTGKTTGGDIETGLSVIDYMSVDVNASNALSVAVVNETFPFSPPSLTGECTIFTSAGADGYYKAEGK